MASTRFQSGIDDASKPPGFRSVQQVPPGNGRFDFQRHIDNGAAGASRAWEVGSALDSFVDDRCPTIWGETGHNAFMPKVRVGRPLDAPISAEATMPIGDLRERAHDGATFFASAIDPGLANNPRPAEVARPAVISSPQINAAEGATYFASAIDPGLSSGPARAQEDRTRLLVPQELKLLAKHKTADDSAGKPAKTTSAIDAGTRVPASAPAQGANAPRRDVSTIDAGTLAPPDESLFDVPRATGIKPLDGDLLRKLFKHTMNEKHRAGESFRPQSADRVEVDFSSPTGKVYRPPNGFHIPDRQDLRDARDAAKSREEEAIRQAEQAKEAAKWHAAEITTKAPSKSGSAVSVGRNEASAPKDPTRMIRILAKSGEEAFVPMPNLASGRQPSTRSEPVRAQKAAGTIKPPIQQLQPKKPDQSNKPSKVQQQIQSNTQKEASEQRGKAAKVAAQALMSGALPSKEQAKSESGSGHGSAQDSGVGFGNMFGEAASVHSRPRSLAAMQPTAESRSSSVKRGSANRASSGKQAPTKAPLASGWQELGETTYKAATSKSPSQASHAKSAARSASVAEWLEINTPPVLSPTARSVKERSQAGWEELGDGVRRADSAKHSNRESDHSAGFRAASVHSFQSIVEGWGNEQNVDKASLAPSMQSFRQNDAAWPTVVSERKASKHSSFAAHSRVASATKSQAVFQGWQEIPPDRASVASGAKRSQALSVQSRQLSNGTRSIDEDVAPLAGLNPSPMQFEAASPQISHAWTQRDAQHIEPWPQYKEPQQGSPSPSQIQLPRSASISQYSHRTHAELDYQLPSRRSSAASHRFEPSVHSPSVRSERGGERISMHSLAVVDEEDFAQRSAAESVPPPMTRNTAHAGRGWITPHPLSPTSSIAGPQSKVVLPSDAHPNGRTLTYDEWKEMQERGMRLHRNISITESSKTRNGIFQDERYQHPGWEGADWKGDEPDEAASQASRQTGRPSNYHSPTVRSEPSERSVVYSGSGWSSGRRSGHAQTIHESREPSVHPSERQWEEMEEGVAGWRSHASGSAREELQDYIDSRPASTAGSFRSGRW